MSLQWNWEGGRCSETVSAQRKKKHATSNIILPKMLEDITAIIADYRASVTAPDVVLLAVCLSFWSAVYYEAVLSPGGNPHGFDRSTLISNLHSVPLCVLAALSIAELIPEAVPVCWSVGFFVVDLVDCVTRRDLMWTVHAVISLVLNVATGFVPRHIVLRSRSRGFLTEASTVRLKLLKRGERSGDWPQHKSHHHPLSWTAVPESLEALKELCVGLHVLDVIHCVSNTLGAVFPLSELLCQIERRPGRDDISKHSVLFASTGLVGEDVHNACQLQGPRKSEERPEGRMR